MSGTPRRHAYLLQREDDEAAAAAALDDNRQELWVDGAEGGVPGRLGDPDVIVALLLFGRLTIHVPKLTAAHPERHGCRRTRRLSHTHPSNLGTASQTHICSIYAAYTTYTLSGDKQTQIFYHNTVKQVSRIPTHFSVKPSLMLNI